ncbi:MAG: bifunctional diaminohydroxyphosphoribosylaminopyrimidine deaminase/5-amino-6-(5-phosphoribosylamino)uracil reductase RibD [Proteobacteria bacterium]|nr:bifunctional diaminohydroxyphosphoribosylaminopyrimidine deaminase/5-amino-6-(5-phosphoribosylamino)uracil reductase RibD [Pseudomonadota bacterium]
MTVQQPPEHFMEQALSLAKQGRPSPNPQVGALVVKNQQVLGQGFHQKPGEPHAEVLALAQAGDDARGADLYVTLEPCGHYGRTGPCTLAIQAAGIARVFIGMIDPDSLVQGKSINWLRAQGIEVQCGILQSACEDMLAGYAHQRKFGHPLVTLKAAITLDGFLACTNGDSKWISSPPSRRRVHEIRAQNDAILVGINTVLADDPLLTVRDVDGKTPLRIVLDSQLRIPDNAQLLQTAAQDPVLIVHTTPLNDATKKRLDRPGVSLYRAHSDLQGRISLPSLLAHLGERGVLSLLVEGGAQIHSAFLTTQTAHRFVLFVAPKFIGAGIPWISFPGVQRMDQAVLAQALQTTSSGADVLITGTFQRND